MTREEAIKHLSLYVGNDCYTDRMQTACKMAIAALREQAGEDTNVPTNADHIRAMTDNELAEFLAPAFSCYRCPARLFCEKNDAGIGCDELVLNWLKQPYKEDT